MGMSYGCGAYGGSPSYNDPGEDLSEEEKEKDKNESPEVPTNPTPDVKIPWTILALGIAIILAILGALGYIGYEMFFSH